MWQILAKTIRRRFLQVCGLGIVLFIAWQFLWSTSNVLPSTQERTELPGDLARGSTFVSLFETEGIECPSPLVSDDGLGVRSRLPQALLVGAMKCGTGAIKKFLAANYAISVSSAEFHHFSNDTRYSRGLEAYRALLPQSLPRQLTLEGSPSYWPAAPKSARRIYAMNPCVKVIVTVIDPVERLASHFAHNNAKNLSDAYRDGQRVQTFHEFYFYPNGSIRTDAIGINIGLYASNLKRWLTYFPYKRILVVDGSVLKDRPWVVMKEIELFLELPHKIHKHQFYRRNDDKGFCNKKVGCLGKSKGREHPDVSPSDTERLRDFFRASNDELFDIIGKRMEWAY